MRLLHRKPTATAHTSEHAKIKQAEACQSATRLRFAYRCCDKDYSSSPSVSSSFMLWNTFCTSRRPQTSQGVSRSLTLLRSHILIVVRDAFKLRALDFEAILLKIFLDVGKRVKSAVDSDVVAPFSTSSTPKSISSNSSPPSQRLLSAQP